MVTPISLLPCLRSNFFDSDYAGSVLLPFLYVAILIFDGIYLAATLVYARRERSAKRHNLR